MATEPRHYLVLLLYEPRLALGVVNIIAPSGIACDDVFAPIQIGNESDRNLSPPGSAFDEIITFVIEVVEQGPGDSFKNSGFTRAIGAANRYYSWLERQFPFGVILDVLEFDSGDSQGRKIDGWSSIIDHWPFAMVVW